MPVAARPPPPTTTLPPESMVVRKGRAGRLEEFPRALTALPEAIAAPEAGALGV